MNYREFHAILNEGVSKLGIPLTAQQVNSFYNYLNELIVWNKRINLISRASPQDIIFKDFLDSLTINKYLDSGVSMVDLGSGAGFPGIPIKIIRPDVSISLFEIKRKKIYFLQHIIRCLNLRRINARWDQGEESEQSFDVVVSRAFGTLAKFLREGIPMIKPSGILLAMKGRKGKEELKENFSLIQEMGLNLMFCDHFKLPVLEHERVIIGLKKG